MKVIITGGTGLIGRALTASLLDDKHEVIVLTRDPKKAPKMPEGTQLVTWDGRTANEWGEHVNGAEAIVNLAGASIDKRWTPEYKKLIRESRINAGKAVVEAIQQATQKPKVLIQASAVGYYGPHGDDTVTEATPAGADFLAEVCREWEASTETVEAMGVRRVIIRTGIVLSKQGGALAKLLPVYRFFAGGPVASGKQYMPWIHILDEVNAIRYLMNNPKAAGIYNLSAPKPVTSKEFARSMGKAMNRPAFAPVPGLAMKAMFGEMSTIIVDGQRAVPQHLQQDGYKFRFDEPETALRHILYSGFAF